jgi:hypothetical protein
MKIELRSDALIFRDISMPIKFEGTTKMSSRFWRFEMNGSLKSSMRKNMAKAATNAICFIVVP